MSLGSCLGSGRTCSGSTGSELSVMGKNTGKKKESLMGDIGE